MVDGPRNEDFDRHAAPNAVEKCLAIASSKRKYGLLAARLGTVDGAAGESVVRDVGAFIEAVGKHRNWDRTTDPPRV